MICEAVLMSALALPLYTKNDYAVLKEFIETRYPEDTVVFVNENETLLNPGSQYTGINVVDKPPRRENLAVWTIKQAA